MLMKYFLMSVVYWRFSSNKKLLIIIITYNHNYISYVLLQLSSVKRILQTLVIKDLKKSINPCLMLTLCSSCVNIKPTDLLIILDHLRQKQN